MNCRWMRDNLGAYHDGELPPVKRWFARLHLLACSKCFEESDRLEGLESIASQLSPVRPPSNLEMQIRLAVRREMAKETWWRRTVRVVRASFSDLMRPLAIRGAGGLTAAVLLFGVIMPDLWTVRAASFQDVPLTYLARDIVAPPAVTRLAPNGIHEDIMVMAYIDRTGEVYDFELLNVSADGALRLKIGNTLLFSEFEPATSFGRPVAGQLLITFTQFTVKG